MKRRHFLNLGQFFDIFAVNQFRFYKIIPGRDDSKANGADFVFIRDNSIGNQKSERFFGTFVKFPFADFDFFFMISVFFGNDKTSVFSFKMSPKNFNPVRIDGVFS